MRIHLKKTIQLIWPSHSGKIKYDNDFVINIIQKYIFRILWYLHKLDFCCRFDKGTGIGER